MKRFIFLTLLCLSAVISFAGNGEVVNIPMSQQNTNGHHKDDLTPPEVAYSYLANVFIVSFDATESYTFEVKDAAGVTLYSSPVVTDGNAHFYPLNLSNHSFYLITIYSTDNTFIGVLFTP